MELYSRYIRILDVNVIYCLFPIIVTILLAELFFKNRFQTKKIFNLIRWVIICYSVVGLFYYVLGSIIAPEGFAFYNRATGPYWFAYWFMVAAAILMPLSLLYKKLANKPLYLLFVAVLMKSGAYFEGFVIMVTSYHRDFSPHSTEWFFLPTALLLLFLQGCIIGIVLIMIFEVIEKRKQVV